MEARLEDLRVPTAVNAAPALKLFVRGFRRMERQLLEATVLLSQRRTPRLELLAEAQVGAADVVMIDALDADAMQWAKERPWLSGKTVIWVDGTHATSGHIVAPRPVQWPILPMLLARALEQGSRRAVEAANPSVGKAAPSAAISRNVLVVDDSLAVRGYLRSLLEGDGLVVRDANSGEAGVEAAAAAPFACILMDVLMPGIDGYEACRRIKAQRRGEQAPAIVMLTSKSSPFDRIRGKMAGCDAYLTKPIEPQKLHEVLARYVAVSEARLTASIPRPIGAMPAPQGN